MALLSNPQSVLAAFTNWLPVLTPLTLIGLAWKARGFFDNLVTNHITHMKQEILDAVSGSVVEEQKGHKEITDALNKGNDKIIETIRDGNERIVNTLITLSK